MRTKMIAITPLAIAGVVAAVLTAPVGAAADVQCSAQIRPSLCQSPGNAQFQSTPNSAPSGDFSSYGPFFSYDRGRR